MQYTILRVLQKLSKHMSLNSLAKLKALLYFEDRSLILVLNIRQGKRFFCVLVCCSAVCLAGWHIKEILQIRLKLKIQRSKVHFLRLKQQNFCIYKC